MTEKQYGGNSSFGFRGEKSSVKSESNDFVKSKKEKSKLETSKMSGEEIKSYIRAGEIAKEVRKFVKGFVKKNMLFVEISEGIENKIKELGGEFAFPINLSLDDVAAHYTPSKNDETRANGLLKVDFGVVVDGFIADTAMSFDFSDDGRYKEMIELNEKVLESALGELEIGSSLKVIGNKISEMVNTNGKFKIIKNLAGHSLGENSIHAGLTISNTKNESNFELRDIAIAIEPFLTTGAGEIYEGKPSEIYFLQNDRVTRDRDARKLIEFVKENYKTRPFCKRWVEKAGLAKVNFCLSILVKEGILYNFPVLVEKEHKPISQAEHTVLFADKVYVTTR